MQSIDPATDTAIATHPEMNAAEVEAALAAAVAAQRDWRTRGADERAALVGRIGDAFAANERRLAEMAVAEMGKTVTSAIAEVRKCVAAFRHYAEHGRAYLEPPAIVGGEGGVTARWLPIGVVLAIMPWNFPYWQVVRFLAPTLVAGNGALLKHASQTQGCAALIEEMVRAAGAPDGLFRNLAIGSDRVAAVIDDPRIAAVTLTGSEGAGAKVGEQAGRLLKKVVLELGGSDPFVVMPSADVEAAAAAAVTARAQNAGQSCICAKRMIVHADVHDAFLDRFVAGMKALRIGDPMADDTDMGPLSSVAQRDEVLAQVDRLVAAGGRCALAPERIDRPGAWMTPGVVTDVPPDHPVACQEVFGPVALVFRASDLDDAIRIANAVPFGLGSSVWTNDADERERLVREVEAGMTAVNRMLASVPEAPFGGIKRSGHGRELGPWGMHEFMNLKAVFG